MVLKLAIIFLFMFIFFNLKNILKSKRKQKVLKTKRLITFDKNNFNEGSQTNDFFQISPVEPKGNNEWKAFRNDFDSIWFFDCEGYKNLNPKPIA